MAAKQRHLALSLILISLVFWGTLFFTLRNPESGPRDATWEKIQTTRILRVGVDPTIPPFAEWTPEKPIGLDPSLAELLAQELGVQVQFTLLSYDGTYDALLLGHVDMVIAGMRPQRYSATDQVAFSLPYFDAGHVLVSREGWASLAEVRGKKLAVEFASEGDLFAQRDPALILGRYFTAQEALSALHRGEVEAALVDHVSAVLALKTLNDPTLHIAPQAILPDPYIIAMRRQGWRLQHEVNRVLERLQNNGTLEGIIDRWLVPTAIPGPSPTVLPLTPTPVAALPAISLTPTPAP
jgi:polar amino acid transport system substrate-binding protein